jgi:hypothetical protein
MRLPKTIGFTADKIYQVREERKKAQKVVDKLKDLQRTYEDHFEKLAKEQKTDSARGKLATVSVRYEPEPSVENWDQLYKYIVKNDAFDLLMRRVIATAWRDRVAETKKKVPGVGIVTVRKISINKRGKAA